MRTGQQRQQPPRRQSLLPPWGEIKGLFSGRKRRHGCSSAPSCRPIVSVAGLWRVDSGNVKGLRTRIENSFFESLASARGTFNGSPRASRRRAPERTCEDDLERGKEEEDRGTMASVIAVCSGVGRKKLTRLTAVVSLPNPGTHAGKVAISFPPCELGRWSRYR